MKKLSQTFIIILTFVHYASAQIDLTKNLVLYFPFSNNYNDASGLGATASNFNGGPSFGYDRNSQPNSALSFNGNGSLRINTSNNALSFGTSTSFTMSFWFKTNNTTFQDLFYNIGVTSSSGITLSLNEYATGEFSFIDHGSYSSDWVQFKFKNAALLDNHWHHLLIIVNQGTKASGIFIDGVYQYGVSFTGKNPNASPEDITKNYVGENFVGGFDELRFYSRALNQVEINALAGLSTAVNEIAPNTKFYFQNPVSDKLNIEFEKPVSLKQIKIYQISGKEVLSYNLTNETTTTKVSLSLASVNDGLYFMEIEDTDNRIYRSHIVINR